MGLFVKWSTNQTRFAVWVNLFVQVCTKLKSLEVDIYGRVWPLGTSDS